MAHSSRSFLEYFLDKRNDGIILTSQLESYETSFYIEILRRLFSSQNISIKIIFQINTDTLFTTKSFGIYCQRFNYTVYFLRAVGTDFRYSFSNILRTRRSDKLLIKI